jgi:hypothetical protein
VLTKFEQMASIVSPAIHIEIQVFFELLLS